MNLRKYVYDVVLDNEIRASYKKPKPACTHSRRLGVHSRVTIRVVSDEEFESIGARSQKPEDDPVAKRKKARKPIERANLPDLSPGDECPHCGESPDNRMGVVCGSCRRDVSREYSDPTPKAEPRDTPKTTNLDNLKTGKLKKKFKMNLKGG